MMLPEPFLQSLQRHIKLTESQQELLADALKKRLVRRKQFLLQEGEQQEHAIFVLSGCLRSYSIDRNGFEHILQFAPSGWWIADMRSYLKQEPATLYIDAVEDSEVLLLPRTSLDRLLEQIPLLERFFRILAENALATYQHRLIEHLSLPAKDRYQQFCQTYPGLIEQLSQKLVASYIGVTPEFLSKMLRQENGKK